MTRLNRLSAVYRNLTSVITEGRLTITDARLNRLSAVYRNLTVWERAPSESLVGSCLNRLSAVYRNLTKASTRSRKMGRSGLNRLSAVYRNLTPRVPVPAGEDPASVSIAFRLSIGISRIWQLRTLNGTARSVSIAFRLSIGISHISATGYG